MNLRNWHNIKEFEEYSFKGLFRCGRWAHAIGRTIICFLSNQSTPHCTTYSCETTLISRLDVNPVTDPSLKSIKGVSCLGNKKQRYQMKTSKISLKQNSVKISEQYTYTYIVYPLLSNYFLYSSLIVYSLFKCYWIVVFIQNIACESQKWLIVKQYLGVLRFKRSLRVCHINFKHSDTYNIFIHLIIIIKLHIFLSYRLRLMFSTSLTLVSLGSPSIACCANCISPETLIQYIVLLCLHLYIIHRIQ